MTKDKILVAGATGYLGKNINKELLSRKYKTKNIVPDAGKVKKILKSRKQRLQNPKH